MRLLTSLAVLLLSLAVVHADKPNSDGVREIAVKPGGFPKGDMGKPTLITSADELAKVSELEGSLETIKKKIDFSKEKLVYFAWSGSGQDKVTVDVNRDKNGGTLVAFILTRGRTKDLRGHQRLFALAKDTNFVVAPAAQ